MRRFELKDSREGGIYIRVHERCLSYVPTEAIRPGLRGGPGLCAVCGAEISRTNGRVAGPVGEER
jgi:hypothetical protein